MNRRVTRLAAHTPRHDPDAASRMDAMHERTSASLPAEERDLHDRMHETCTGHHDERTIS